MTIEGKLSFIKIFVNYRQFTNIEIYKEISKMKLTILMPIRQSSELIS